MNKYLGSDPALARTELEGKGYCVTLTEVRSKKGISGGVARVIAVRSVSEKEIELCYSYFIRDVGGCDE